MLKRRLTVFYLGLKNVFDEAILAALETRGSTTVQRQTGPKSPLFYKPNLKKLEVIEYNNFYFCKIML